MSFRRIPFQFSSSDPAERQRELEKRFGLPSRNKMYVDSVNPLSMGSGFRESSTCSSPRLQHRVPIFVDGYDQSNRSSVDSTGSASENKKPKVRVIPIEVEGAETVPSARHRTYSGPAGFSKEHNEEPLPQKDDASPLKRSMQDLTKPSKMKATIGPKVHNIPIKVEGADTIINNSAPFIRDHSKVNESDKSNNIKVVKSANEQTADPKISEEQKIEININNLLKKIENILEELKSYESGVKEFSGTAKDKQYRYLDEMLTRCMLRLDDIDTLGSDKVRFARKNAVKQVQSCIDLLEEKISASNETERGPVAINEFESNMKKEAKELLKHEESTGGLTQEVSQVLEHTDKIEDLERTEVSETEMVDIMANSVSEVNIPVEIRKPVEGIEAIHSKSPLDISLNNISEIKALENLGDSTVNLRVSEVSDVEMVKITANSVPGDSIPVENTEDIKSVSSQEDCLCNLRETKALEQQDSSGVNVDVPSEVEMKEALSPYNNSETQLEMPQCRKETFSDNKVLSAEISQESDVEMKEIENTLNEIKEKTLNANTIELNTIPKEDTAQVTENLTLGAGHCKTQSNCHNHTVSSPKDLNMKETAHGD